MLLLILTWCRNISDNTLQSSTVKWILQPIICIWTGTREAWISLLRQTQVTADVLPTRVVSCSIIILNVYDTSSRLTELWIFSTKCPHSIFIFLLVSCWNTFIFYHHRLRQSGYFHWTQASGFLHLFQKRKFVEKWFRFLQTRCPSCHSAALKY